MQQPGGKIRYSKRNKRKHSIRSPHISSFGILNRNGLEIPVVATVDMSISEEDNESKRSTFTDGTMPEQPHGYIKCKKHDFF